MWYGQTLEKRKITPGISNWVYTEVLAGLTENETVVTSATLEGLGDGLEIRIKESGSDAQ